MIEDILSNEVVIGALSALAIFALQAIAKSIPDDAAGFKGIIRKALKFVTIYIENNAGKPTKDNPETKDGGTGPTPPPIGGG